MTDTSTAAAETAQHEGFLAGGGELAALIDAFDWSRTPLGPIRGWPAPLRTTVGLILRSPVPIVTLWGEAGTMIYNDAYSVFAGGRHPKLLGSAVREGWPEVADFNDNVMKVVLGGGTLSYTDQELTLHRSGAPEQVWLNLDYSPVIDEAGRPIGVIAVVVETTEGVRATRALRRNEERLRFLDALTRETAASSDADAILTVTTRMVGEHLGVTNCAYADMDVDEDGFTIRGDWAAPGSQHIVGHYNLADFGRLAVRNLGAGLPLIINDARKELEPAEADTFRRIGTSATICMPLIKGGKLTALMAIHRDAPHAWSDAELALLREVTERSWAHIERVRSEAAMRESDRKFRAELERQVEERTAALAKSEESIRTIFQTSHLFQSLVTTDGILRFANTTALQAIDARLEDLVGTPYWEAPWFSGTPGAAEQVRAALQEAATGKPVNFAMTVTMPSGQRVFDCSVRPVVDETGLVVALVPESIDVTTRVRAEQALLQAQKIEAIGNLTGGIAHDFNNLLMAVLGSLELLRKRLPDDPALLRLVDTATEGARRGKSLTARMLAFARRQELKTERIDVGRLVYDMSELMKRSLGPMISLDIRIEPDLPPIEADANQLEAALLNLAVNARDAMDGEGRIIITARAAEIGTDHPPLPAGRYLCLAVADAGEGMDAETLKRATEPFFTTKGVGKGTGLGLSMVHGLAEQSGGALRLRSKPGQGTTAEIWLPASDSVAAAQEPRPAGEAGSPGGAVRLSVLAVDDDALILMNTVAMLEDLGHDVVSASSGAQALERMEGRRFDLLVTDQAMPNMTGLQLIAAATERAPDMAVVLATGYAEIRSDAATGLQRLSKPFAQEELARAIAAAVARLRGA